MLMIFRQSSMIDFALVATATHRSTARMRIKNPAREQKSEGVVNVIRTFLELRWWVSFFSLTHDSKSN